MRSAWVVLVAMVLAAPVAGQDAAARGRAAGVEAARANGAVLGVMLADIGTKPKALPEDSGADPDYVAAYREGYASETARRNRIGSVASGVAFAAGYIVAGILAHEWYPNGSRIYYGGRVTVRF